MDSEARTTLIFKAIPVIITIADAVFTLSGVCVVPTSGAFVLGLIRLLTIWMIIQDGTILRSRIFRPFLFVSLALLGIGALLKIMHWTYSGHFLVAGFSLAAGFYTVRFFLKKDKRLFDLIKWLWVLLGNITAGLTIFHIYTSEAIESLPAVMLIALLLAYLRELMDDSRRPPEPITN